MKRPKHQNYLRYTKNKVRQKIKYLLIYSLCLWRRYFLETSKITSTVNYLVLTGAQNIRRRKSKYLHLSIVHCLWCCHLTVIDVVSPNAFYGFVQSLDRLLVNNFNTGYKRICHSKQLLFSLLQVQLPTSVCCFGNSQSRIPK